MITLYFQNNIVLVTGASHGIGQQIALDFLNCGAKLIVTATHPSSKPIFCLCKPLQKLWSNIITGALSIFHPWTKHITISKQITYAI